MGCLFSAQSIYVILVLGQCTTTAHMLSLHCSTKWVRSLCISTEAHMLKLFNAERNELVLVYNATEQVYSLCYSSIAQRWIVCAMQCNSTYVILQELTHSVS